MGQAWRDHQARQHKGASGPHRRRLDISLPRTCKPDDPGGAGGITKTVREIAWKGQVRLCARYREPVAAGKPKVIAVTAIAREMAAFLWANRAGGCSHSGQRWGQGSGGNPPVSYVADKIHASILDRGSPRRTYGMRYPTGHKSMPAVV